MYRLNRGTLACFLGLWGVVRPHGPSPTLLGVHSAEVSPSVCGRRPRQIGAGGAFTLCSEVDPSRIETGADDSRDYGACVRVSVGTVAVSRLAYQTVPFVALSLWTANV